MLKFTCVLFAFLYSDLVLTPGNIWGNCIASVVIEHLSRNDLPSAVDEEMQNKELSDCTDGTVDFEVNVEEEEEEEEEEEKKEKEEEERKEVMSERQDDVAVEIGEEENRSQKPISLTAEHVIDIP